MQKKACTICHWKHQKLVHGLTYLAEKVTLLLANFLPNTPAYLEPASQNYFSNIIQSQHYTPVLQGL